MDLLQGGQLLLRYGNEERGGLAVGAVPALAVERFGGEVRVPLRTGKNMCMRFGPAETIVEIASLNSHVSAMQTTEDLLFGRFERAQGFGAVEEIHFNVLGSGRLREGAGGEEQQGKEEAKGHRMENSV